jgi:inner membrane transporter RhtA
MRETGQPRAAFPILPLAACIVAMAGFQVGASFARTLFPAIGPVGTASLRLLFGALMLTALTRPWRSWPAKAPWGSLLALGASMACAITFFYLSIDRLPQGVAVAIQFLGPLSVAILGSRRPVDFLWAALAAAGLWLLLAVGQRFAGMDRLGVLYALCAAAGWAFYILVGRRVGAAFGSSTGALALAVAAIVILPFGALQAGWALASPSLMPMALWVAFLAAALPFSLEFYALPRLQARTFATFTSLEPAIGVLSGFLLSHDRLTLIQIGGVAAVMAAAAGAAWSGAERTAPTITDAPPT